MNRRPFVAGLFLMLAMLMAGAVPAVAAAPAPTGDPLFLFAGDQSYAADTAFFVRGGFIEERGSHAWGKWEYSLELDGAVLKPSFRINDSTPDGTIVRLWVFNFPEGMTGTHTLVGRYDAPCQDDTINPCNGLRANSLIEVASFPAEITFV